VVAGLVLSGALVGPKALSLAHDPEAIEVIAEVGVIFLLFTIGLEFSLARLQKYFRQVALGGFLQVSVTALVTSAVCLALVSRCPEADCIWVCLCLIQHRPGFRTLGETWRIGCTPWKIYRGYPHFPGSLHRSDGSDRSPACQRAGQA
jgi:hypothetical protein